MHETAPQKLDLGKGFSLRYLAWTPDRSIEANEIRYADVPDVERLGAIIRCRHGIEGAIHFDQGDDVYKAIFPNAEWWLVASWDPLTITPSVLCSDGCHGFIRYGKWVDV